MSPEIIFPFHITALVFVAIVLFLADGEAFAWFRGKKPVLDGKKLRLYHRLMWTGLILMMVTGFGLFWPARGFLLGSTVFLIKMFFVGLLAINSFFIGNLMDVALLRSYASLTTREKMPLFISGAVSGISWLGAFTAAFFLFD